MTSILNKFAKKDLLSFPEGEVIMDFDCKCSGIYIILEGKINVYKKENGIEKKLFTLLKGQAMGIAEIFHGEKSVCKAVSEEAVKAYYISGKDFLNAIINDKSLMLEVIQNFSKQINKIEAQSKNLFSG